MADYVDLRNKENRFMKIHLNDQGHPFCKRTSFDTIYVTDTFEKITCKICLKKLEMQKKKNNVI